MRVREHEAAVHRDGVGAILDQHHVQAEFAEAAQRYDLQGFHKWLHDTSWRRHRRSRQDFLISVKWLVGLQISCDDFLNLRAQTAQSTWAKFLRHDRRTYRY